MFHCQYIFVCFLKNQCLILLSKFIPTCLLTHQKQLSFKALTGVGEEKISITQRAFQPLTLSDLPPELRITARDDQCWQSLFHLYMLCWGGERLRTISLSPSQRVFSENRSACQAQTWENASLRGMLSSQHHLPPTPVVSVADQSHITAFFI